MKATDLPFNVEILDLTPDKLRTLRPIRTTSIMDSSGQKLGPVDKLRNKEASIAWEGSSSVSSSLHDDGLFSIPIFGQVGDENRDKRFSYVEVKVKVFHPLIYKSLIKLKSLYKGILEGSTYAVWDEDEKDFVSSNEADGETGFQFFVKHWEKIQFKKSQTPSRKQRIELINKYKDRAMTNKILVMPAGLRDVRALSTGRLDFDPINDIYQRIVGISQTIAGSGDKTSSPAHDYSRHLIQKAFNEIYSEVEKMLSGKKGLIQSKWASRRVFNGTRNVISSMDSSKSFLGGSDEHKASDTIVGLYQIMRGVRPLTMNLLRNGWLGEVFPVGDSSTGAQLINKKTWKREYVDLPSIVKDRWTTLDGLERVINSYQDLESRHRYVEIEGYYLGLIYKGPDKTFKIFGDIGELPEGVSKEHVEPLSLVELLYLSGYQRWNSVKAIITRYPVTGIDSSYPSDVYVKTSVKGESRQELGPDWEPLGEERTAHEFPTKDPKAFIDSTIVSSVRLAGLGGDFDGDTVSCNFLYSEEAINEVERTLHSREAYVDAAGGLRTSTDLDTVALVLRNMTGAFK